MLCMIMLGGHHPLKRLSAMYALLANEDGIALVEQSFAQTLLGTAAAEAPVTWTDRGPVLEAFAGKLENVATQAPNRLWISQQDIARIWLHKVIILGFSTYIETTTGQTYRLDSKYRYNPYDQVQVAFAQLFPQKFRVA